MLKRRQDAKGGSWLDNLDAVIAAYNDTEHGGIDAEPGDIDDDKIFSLKKQAAIALQENTELLEKRRQKLEKKVHIACIEPKARGGLRRRIDANTWSKENTSGGRLPTARSRGRLRRQKDSHKVREASAIRQLSTCAQTKTEAARKPGAICAKAQNHAAYKGSVVPTSSKNPQEKRSGI
ncbi:MAG: hypothetical protein ACFHHU_01470 [Porticoccaceae bacterium]